MQTPLISSHRNHCQHPRRRKQTCPLLWPESLLQDITGAHDGGSGSEIQCDGEALLALLEQEIAAARQIEQAHGRVNQGYAAAMIQGLLRDITHQRQSEEPIQILSHELKKAQENSGWG